MEYAENVTRENLNEAYEAFVSEFYEWVTNARESKDKFPEYVMHMYEARGKDKAAEAALIAYLNEARTIGNPEHFWSLPIQSAAIES